MRLIRYRRRVPVLQPAGQAVLIIVGFVVFGLAVYAGLHAMLP